MIIMKKITSHFPESALPLLVSRGEDLIDSLGLDALRDVVEGVLTGENIRSATEHLTRRRTGLVCNAMFRMYVSIAQSGLSPDELIDSAYSQYLSKDNSVEEKIILRWMLGLTQKQVQNVLRSDSQNWERYIETLFESINGIEDTSTKDYGPNNSIYLGEPSIELNWEWQSLFSMAIGSATLAVRGSEKSIYGKFFEKLILGSVLSVMGFTLSEKDRTASKVFWLSSRSDKRESDATLIFKVGLGVRFDIGFIGVGNSEITLDKTSRFAKMEEISGIPHNLYTIIIVDRVGKNSRVIQQAKAINSSVVQMSDDDWAIQLGVILEKVLPGFVSPLSKNSKIPIKIQIKNGVKNAPLEEILKLAIETSEDVDAGLEED